ncbi:Phenylacrylic acid decarboxylase [Wickerhamomyces ciferrii]|uniref:Flavin prenyltransferase PAD1, mitochondrial n=1 Tax=Wickerhamomyces ciferrii (strain ATCC 14091 / BCRC 22168 / CBS 111 / JCM 3599 / NBRC 0793 / NRRL Y-1031 F-60-10) TaxID=1206466 RepID=K0KUE0_WICCF|nr:Phenylacrylic acid decarboxylase [Wickerhamomyces ciferrii]CCH46771.1 Phenylacrylic acid decarboxylase [Wickerhamomyces ciferrii]
MLIRSQIPKSIWRSSSIRLFSSSSLLRSSTPSSTNIKQSESIDKQSPEYKEFQEFQKWKNLQSQSTLDKPKRIVVAITGATGVVLGVKILEMLQKLGVETHVIISKWGVGTMKFETDYTLKDITRLSTVHYLSKDVSAPISSGSFHHDGMIVVPCSMKTLSAIRTGYTEDLIVRAADVTIKEKRRLLLCVRETPLSSIHLENMLSLSNKDVIIFPPVPAFYTRPKSIDDIVQQTSGRILDFFGLDTSNFPRWNGMTNPNVVEDKDEGSFEKE